MKITTSPITQTSTVIALLAAQDFGSPLSGQMSANRPTHDPDSTRRGGHAFNGARLVAVLWRHGRRRLRRQIAPYLGEKEFVRAVARDGLGASHFVLTDRQIIQVSKQGPLRRIGLAHLHGVAIEGPANLTIRLGSSAEPGAWMVGVFNRRNALTEGLEPFLGRDPGAADAGGSSPSR